MRREEFALARAAVGDRLHDDVERVGSRRFGHIAKAVGLHAEVDAADRGVGEAAERRKRQAGECEFSEFASGVHEALVRGAKAPRYWYKANEYSVSPAAIST